MKDKDELTFEANLNYKVNNLELSTGYKTNTDKDSEVGAGFKYSW